MYYQDNNKKKIQSEVVMIGILSMSYLLKSKKIRESYNIFQRTLTETLSTN